jgi:hypothetical protein
MKGKTMKTATARKTERAIRAASAARKPKREMTVHRPTRPQTLAEVCFQAAKDKSIDVAKMQALMQLATEQEWTAAMLATQNEIAEHKIVKDAWNPHTKSHYPKLESIQKVVDPIIRKHGFVLSYGMSDSPLDDHYRVICDVRHKNGHTKRYEKDIGMDTTGPKGGGTKSPAQGSGSSSSYGKRYLLVDIFNIPVVGEDHDGASARQQKPTISQEQLDKLTDLLEGQDAVIAKLFAAYSIKYLEQLRADKFDEAYERAERAVVAADKAKAAKAKAAG